MNYWGGAEVLGPAISDRAVGMGAEGSEGMEGIGAGGTGAEATGAVVGGAEGTDIGTDGDGAGGSSVCSAIGDRSPW